LKKKLGVLISGQGSNLTAIHQNCLKNIINAEISCVISNKKDASGLEWAKQQNLPHYHLINEEEIVNTLQKHDIDLVILAGYMKLISGTLLNAYPHKVLNIHPSLLPSFKGLHAQKKAFEYGVKISGCTVHIVTTEMDSGPILMQKAVEVKESDTVESLSKRILKEEHILYSQAINTYINKGIPQ